MLRPPCLLLRLTAFLFAVAAGAPLVAASEGRVSGAWRLFNLNGRDYVTVQNVLQFYGLQETTILAGPARTLSPAARGLSLLSSDTREVYLGGVRHWLCFPTEEINGQTLISRMDLVKTIEPVLRPHLIRGLQRFDTVVIDAGHGGHDRGARSRYGYEKEYTLDTARRLKVILESLGLRVIMTRNRDVFLPLEKRAEIANKQPRAIFVSIHFNAGNGSAAASGLEVFAITPRGAPSTSETSLQPHHLEPVPGNENDAASLMLAASVHRAILSAKNGQLDRGVKRARFSVLANCRKPAVLVEGGFLSNPAESRLIATTSYRSALARAIAKGILSYRALALGDSRGAPLPVSQTSPPSPPPAPPRPAEDHKPTVTIVPPAEEPSPNKLPGGG